MKVGPHAGKKVSEAKPIIKEAMLADGSGLAYSEPEKMVSGCCASCC
jgi:leucyl-tRNA synthetase